MTRNIIVLLAEIENSGEGNGLREILKFTLEMLSRLNYYKRYI